MRLLSVLLAAFLAIGAGEASPDPAAWLQERLDRILARTGKAPGEIKAVIANTTDMPWLHPAESVQFPRALLVMAPSPEAVDGMLAMLLSYRAEPQPDGRRDPSTAFAGIQDSSVAGDQAETRLQIGPGRPATPEDPAQVRRDKAWQGARWNSQIGNCAAIQVDFLRAVGKDTALVLDGKSTLWPGSPFSRKVIDYLGALAYPGNQRCKTRDDPVFTAIQQRLRGPSDAP